MLRVYLECDGQYGCHDLELYCPETAECALNCSSSNYVCDGQLFISDPGGQHDDSLLDIHCEDDDCLLILWWCPEIENTTTDCGRTMYLPVTPLDLNCTADTGVCEVRPFYFRLIYLRPTDSHILLSSVLCSGRLQRGGL